MSFTALQLQTSDPQVEANTGYRFGGGKTTLSTSVTASGDTILHTPASGKKITLYWVGLSSSQNNGSEIQVAVRLGTTGGPYTATPYQWLMGNPGAFSHWEKIDAANPNDSLILSMSGAGLVVVNYTYTEA